MPSKHEAKFTGSQKFFEHCKAKMQARLPYGKLNNQDVGAHLGFDVSTTSHWVNGTKAITNVHTIVKICDKLGIEIDDALAYLALDNEETNRLVNIK